jgi:hypothetical protein
MRKIAILLTFVMLSALVLPGLSQTSTPTGPVFTDLPAGQWTSIPGPAGTICSNSTPYQYFVRPADEPSDKLFIHFQGGGACWFGGICDIFYGEPTYDPFADDTDNPAAAPVGLFDMSNEDNPFHDYNMVFVPYCTGDVHIGNAVTTYPVGDTNRNVKIYHQGYANATAVLNWVYGNIVEPSTVFVTGCSAGAIPSPFYAMDVAAAYPDARIAQWGDAAGSYRNVTGFLTTNLDSWGTFDILGEEFAGVAAEDLDFETLYEVAAAKYPNVLFSQFNHAYDGVQTGFLNLGGLEAPNLPQLLAANRANIQTADADNVSFYQAAGNDHCITFSPAIYEYATNGVKLIDWISAIANGVPVKDVICEDCGSPAAPEE